MKRLFQIVPAGSSIIATTPYRVVNMDLKKVMALAMMALMVIPSMTMTVGAFADEDMASAIERARIYLDKVRRIADNMAIEYKDDDDMQVYLNQLYPLLGQDWEGDPEIIFQTGGSGTAEWSSDEYNSESRSAKLYVVNGVTDWAEVSIPVDIALKDITELKFMEYIKSYGPAQATGVAGWSVNVVLGIDADGDDIFEADVAEFHVGTNAWTLDALHGDTFIEMDGALGVPPVDTWTEIDALSVAQWYTPDKDCITFAGSDDTVPSFYGSLADLVTKLIPDPSQNSLILDATARVKCVKLVIGGSVNWNFETAHVDDVTIDGTTYDFEEGEAKEGTVKDYLDQASASLGENDYKSAARNLSAARNILGRIKGLLRSMAKAHKVARTEKFNQKFQRRIQGIQDKIERPKGPKDKK